MENNSAQAVVAVEDNEDNNEWEYYYEDKEVENDGQLETEEPLNTVSSAIQETNDDDDEYEYYEKPEKQNDEYAKHAANTSAVAASSTVINAGERGDFTHIHMQNKDKGKKEMVQFNLISCIALFISILSLIILGIGLMIGMKNGALNSGSTSADAMRINNIIIKKYITHHHITNNISMKPSYNFTFEEPDIGPYQGYNDTSPQIIYPGGWYGWQFSELRTIQGQAARGKIAGTDDLNMPLADIHVSYGDRLIFFMRESNKNDDLILVTKDIFDSCNFSTIADENDDVTNVSAGDLWLTNKYGLYNHYNELEWEPYVFDIINRRNDPINSLKDELLAANILYFTSSYKWDRYDKPEIQSCKFGWKLRVIIDGYRNKTLDIISSNANAIVDTKEMNDLQAGIGHVSRMLILQQFHSENRIRSEGDSGITQTRGNYDGNSDYDDGTYTNGNVLSIHNHANNERVVGIGELSAALNGVEFKTRHNDYNLNMPSRTSSEYHAVESVPYPDVPPEVLSKSTTAEQIIEMQEWFRAFKTQNHTHRNYSLYFKPILCYLEGTWITDSDSILEPFTSDRHYIDAATWKELHDKVRWMANSGRKDTNENYATLPSSVRNLVNDTYPIISNWEYRILCSPLQNDIPISRFRVVDDLSVQLMGSPETRRELKYSRRARFELNKNIDGLSWDKGRMRWNYLDYLMEQIPGKNNYLSNLTDLLPDGTGATLNINNKNEIINSGYYSRFYSLSDSDAMGSSNHRRGYSDRYLFAAKTTHSKVSPISLDKYRGEYKGSDSRWSYAIPIEIIYLTPLSRWNPYSIPFQSDKNLWISKTGKCGENPSQAWVEMKNSVYYLTPSQFFEGNHNEDSADTAIKGACAISPNDNNEYSVEASGHWIVFPSIGNGVGYVRQRYAIFPIHHSGSPAFKEVKAFEQVILGSNYDDVENGIPFWTDQRDLEYGFNLYLEGGGHDHLIFIKGKWIKSEWLNITSNKYYNGEKYIIQQDSDIGNGHTHTVNLYRERQSENHPWIYQIKQCRFGLKNEDDMGYVYQNNSCADFHDTLRRDTGEESNVKGTNA